MYPKYRYSLDHPSPSQDLKAGPWQIEKAEKLVRRKVGQLKSWSGSTKFILNLLQ